VHLHPFLQFDADIGKHLDTIHVIIEQFQLLVDCDVHKQRFSERLGEHLICAARGGIDFLD
ncbi:MAG: hypothetical protein ABF515_05685, partial [Bifidobacterium sp.]